MNRYSEIREECCAANKSLPTSGLVDLTFGNVSLCDRQAGVFAIKPSGVDYTALTPDDMVIVDFDGKVVEGSLNPSSDTPTHRRLFLGKWGQCAKIDKMSVTFAHSKPP
jgi:L-ribulose-5-phosphate 4-epimerase